MEVLKPVLESPFMSCGGSRCRGRQGGAGRGAACGTHEARKGGSFRFVLALNKDGDRREARGIRGSWGN